MREELLRSLGRYRILSKLGEGGMGTVWLAEDTVLQRRVALKLLAPHLASSREARERFLREARAASRLEHSGLAAVQNAGEVDGEVFIAYQLIEGGTLAARVAAGPLTLPELARLAKGCADALAHMHAGGVLHRDLTAGNIMLRPDGAPVIVDFGLARAQGDLTLTRTGVTIGTAAYLAPEQWRNEPGDARTDLWSLGVALYYAATGQQPFDGTTAEAIMYRVMNEEAVRPSQLRAELPPEFERVVLRLLEKDVRDRIQSAADLATVARRLTAESPDDRLIIGEPWSARLARWWRRQARKKVGPTRVVLLLLVAVLVAIGGLYARRQVEARRIHVLAVMPLRNTSGDSLETAYIGEALGEELVRRLGASGGFSILPWSTTSTYVPKHFSITDMSRALQADAILVGRYSSEGDRIEVLAELADGRTGLQIWSERYVRTTADLVQLQTELAIAVSERMARGHDSQRAGRIAASAPSHPEAYEYYVRGASKLQSADEHDQAIAEQMFQRAVALDSTLAVAWVGLGGIHSTRYFQRGPGDLWNLTIADSCFRRALRLKPDLPVAERGLIRVATERGLFDQGLEISGAALNRSPSDLEALITAGWGFTLCGLPEFGRRCLDRARQLDPNNQGVEWIRVIALSWTGDDARAIEAGRGYIRRYGEDAEVYGMIAASSAAVGNLRDAITLQERAVKLGQNGQYAPLALVSLYRTAGDTIRLAAVADSALQELDAKVAADPGDLRLRCTRASLLAERKDWARLLTEAETISVSMRRGNMATGGMESDLVYSSAQLGNPGMALKLLRLLPVTEHTWPPWRRKLGFLDRGAGHLGEASPSGMSTSDFRELRDRLTALHASAAKRYRALVDRATARPWVPS